MRTALERCALLALAALAAACGAKTPAPRTTTVRFVDDAPYDAVHAKCGGRELDDAAAHHVAPDPDVAFAYAGCADAAQLTGPIAPFVGKTLACTLTERSPLGKLDESGFTAEAKYPGGGAIPGLELVFSRSVGNGSDRDGFTGRWAEREQHAEHVLYRHDEGDGVVGGYCEDANVRSLVETLAVYPSPSALVLRSDWRCSGSSRRAFRELRCTLSP